VGFRRFATLGAVCACAVLGACTHTTALKSEAATFDWSLQQKRILLISPDVELGEVTAGGLAEPRADWSGHAARAISTDLSTALAQRGVDARPLTTLAEHREIQLAKLHSVVGEEILLHQLGFSKLPTKNSALDWTLGPGTSDLRAKYGADYAMFVYVRDTYSSDTRKAIMVLGAMAGVAVAGGSQNAFVPLVDLRSGNIVWFNQVASVSGGDLRADSGAESFTQDLLKGLPL
jgi:hypothetical protein